MTNPVAVVRTEVASFDEPRIELRKALLFWCPGCDTAHRIVFWQADGQTGPVWDWDGNETAPTISPSILCHGSVFLHDDGTQCANWHEDYQTESHTQGPCHSFLRAGRWEFLSDSAHHLAGQTVDMVPLPDWLVQDN
jgi:hypothetical protein